MSEEKKRAEIGTREWALDRIRKALAMSKSANETEAANALSQAQKFMEKYRITEDEVSGLEYLTAQVITDYEWPVRKPAKVKIVNGKPEKKEEKPVAIPHAISAVSRVIQWAMGVDAVFEPQRCGQTWMFAVRYFGTRERVMVAEHAHTVVARAVKAAWKEYVRDFPEARRVQGARAGFYLGWCGTVQQKVARLVREPEEMLKIEAYQERFYKCKSSDAAANNQRVLADTMEAGAEAAQDFNIHRPVGESRLRLGHDG